MSDADLELLFHLRTVHDVRSAFITGDGFGFSSVSAASIFSTAAVDIFDIATDACQRQAAKITTDALRVLQIDGRFLVGASQQDLPRALRPGATYDFVILNGLRRREVSIADFLALKLHMAETCVVVFPDRHIAEICAGVEEVRGAWPDFRFRVASGPSYRNFHLTAFMYRGLLEEAFATFSSELDACL